MKTASPPDTQSAIYRVALSLDALLLNGIAYGILQAGVLGDVLVRAATSLQTDLASLEEHVQQLSTDRHDQACAAFASLQASCQELTALLHRLRSFRETPSEHLRADVARILLLREECVRRLQELEQCFQVDKPFYQSRSTSATAAIASFLATLEQLFADEQTAGK